MSLDMIAWRLKSRQQQRKVRLRGLGAVLALLVAGGCGQKASRSASPDYNVRIRYYSQKVTEHPRHYPSYALLGAACLDKARATSDPDWLAKARFALNRSIEIQPNFEAFKTMTALCNFAHRFDDALRWGKRAAEAYPTDTEVTALLVEAYMGAGKYKDAEKLLPPAGKEPADFYTAAALGNYLVSQRRYEEAVRAFRKAADFARAAEVRELVVWAEVSAAGALIDAKQLQRARAHLEVAAGLDAKDKRLRLHRAELSEAEGRLTKALDEYEALLKERNDPEAHRKAFVLARKLGQTSRARLHFEAAEKDFQRAIQAGEIYTLGGLARLYCDADTNLARALALAQRNLKYKRDIEAQETHARVRRKLKDKTQ